MSIMGYYLEIIWAWLISLEPEVIILWIMNGFALSGSLEGCRKNVNLLRMNVLYTIANAYFIFYFIYFTQEWSFVCLQIGFAIFTIRGIIINLKKRNKKSFK